MVRRVTIHGASLILEWFEFAGKTMKAKDSLENCVCSIEALACLVDHFGVIKIQYLNMRTYESYSMWWNEGSLRNIRMYDKSMAKMHPSEILFLGGVDFESWKRLVVYR